MINIEIYQRIEDIQSFLVDEFNYEVYNFFKKAKDKPWEGVFDTLDFFNFFYNNLEVFLKNQNKPIDLYEYFKSLDASDLIKYYFLEKFKEYIHYCSDKPEKKQDAQPLKKIWNTDLKDYHDELRTKIFTPKIQKVPKPIINISPYSRMWQEIEAELKLLSPEDQQKLLIKKKYSLSQEDIDASGHQTFHLDERKNFLKKITLKINELEDIAKISRFTSSNKPQPNEAPLKTNETVAESECSDDFDQEVKEIKNYFDKIDKKKGYNYAFLNSKDFDEYTQLLAKFFLNIDYELPAKPIRMKNKTKTKVAFFLGEIYRNHNRNYHITLTHDTSFHRIVRVLIYFKDIGDQALVRALTSSC